MKAHLSVRFRPCCYLVKGRYYCTLGKSGSHDMERLKPCSEVGETLCFSRLGVVAGEETTTRSRRSRELQPGNVTMKACWPGGCELSVSPKTLSYVSKLNAGAKGEATTTEELGRGLSQW